MRVRDGNQWTDTTLTLLLKHWNPHFICWLISKIVFISMCLTHELHRGTFRSVRGTVRTMRSILIFTLIIRIELPTFAILFPISKKLSYFISHPAFDIIINNIIIIIINIAITINDNYNSPLYNQRDLSGGFLSLSRFFYSFALSWITVICIDLSKFIRNVAAIELFEIGCFHRLYP